MAHLIADGNPTVTECDLSPDAKVNMGFLRDSLGVVYETWDGHLAMVTEYTLDRALGAKRVSLCVQRMKEVPSQDGFDWRAAELHPVKRLPRMFTFV